MKSIFVGLAVAGLAVAMPQVPTCAMLEFLCETRRSSKPS